MGDGGGRPQSWGGGGRGGMTWVILKGWHRWALCNRFWPKGRGLAEGAVKHRKKLIRSPEQTVYSVFCLQLLPLLCVFPVIETHLQEAGPAGMFSAGGISRINQARTLFLPPGEDRQPWAPVTVSALCGSLAVGRSQQGFLKKRTWNIRIKGPNSGNNAKFVKCSNKIHIPK